MKRNDFYIILTILVLAIIGVIGYLGYLTYQNKRQISLTTSNLNNPTQNQESPLTTPENNPIQDNRSAMLQQTGLAFDLPDNQWLLEKQGGAETYFSIGIPNPNYNSANSETNQDKYISPITFYTSMPWAKTETDLYPNNEFKIVSQDVFQNNHNIKIHLYNMVYVRKDDGTPSMFKYGQNLDMAFFLDANGKYVQVYNDDHGLNSKFRTLLQSITVTQY